MRGICYVYCDVGGGRCRSGVPSPSSRSGALPHLAFEWPTDQRRSPSSSFRYWSYRSCTRHVFVSPAFPLSRHPWRCLCLTANNDNERGNVPSAVAARPTISLVIVIYWYTFAQRLFYLVAIFNGYDFFNNYIRFAFISYHHSMGTVVYIVS